MTTEPVARLRAAAQRALESLDDLIANTTDPGVEALGARCELARELSNTSPEMARQVLGLGLRGCGHGAEETHVVTDDSDDPEHADDCPGCEAFSLIGHTAAVLPAPVDRAAILREAAEVAAAYRSDCQNCAVELEVAAELRRLADEAQQPTDTEERPEDAARRFARRLHAVERLCSGRPGYHTVTVKALLTAMSEADDEQPAQGRSTADKAAALGMEPTDYRRYSHDAAVERVREAARGLYAETGQRVMDALEQPAATKEPTR
jgi:hypothetical protein